MPELSVKRCPAPLGGGTCGSAVFYDWGLVLMEDYSPPALVAGTVMERWQHTPSPANIKICARCTTPYVLDGGELIDVSAELSAEEVKAVLARGQVSLPHPKIKDP